MPLIHESKNFIVETPGVPKVHVSRLDGGHLKISPKIPVDDITQLSSELATELIILTQIVGKAFTLAMLAQGIELGIINYQANANFNKTFHLHLYGRATNAPTQKFGTVLQFPPTQSEFFEAIKDNEPLTSEDIKLLQQEITRLVASDEFRGKI